MALGDFNSAAMAVRGVAFRLRRLASGATLEPTKPRIAARLPHSDGGRGRQILGFQNRVSRLICVWDAVGSSYSPGALQRVTVCGGGRLPHERTRDGGLRFRAQQCSAPV